MMKTKETTKISSTTAGALSSAIAELNKQISGKEQELNELKGEKKSLVEFYESRTGTKFKSAVSIQAVEESVSDIEKTTTKVKNQVKKTKTSSNKLASNSRTIKVSKEVKGKSEIVPAKASDVAKKGIKDSIIWAIQELGGTATRSDVKEKLKNVMSGKVLGDNLYWAIKTKQIHRSPDKQTLSISSFKYD